jgi:hypothetical protein
LRFWVRYMTQNCSSGSRDRPAGEAECRLFARSRFYGELSARALGCRRVGLGAVAAIASTMLVTTALAQGQGIAGETNANARRHFDFAGKPCLDTRGTSMPLASNTRILNHVVSFENHCFETIKVKVCYYGTDECTDVAVPPRGRKEQIIGVFPAMQQFRYDVKENF